MVLTPTQSPERLLPTLAELTQEQALDQVDRMTDADLDRLKQEIDQSNDVPEVFKNEDMLAYIEARINHTSEAQSKLDALRAKFEASRSKVEEQAEKSFLAELQEKGGGWAVIASMGISILSFFGFKKAKELKKSLKEKGYLKTAIEGAKEHPIFAAFISAMGLKVGTEAYDYVVANREPLEKNIIEHAKEHGVSVDEAATTLGDKVKESIHTTQKAGLKGLAIGLTSFLGGTYDEETGVITLPHSILRPPVAIAYTASLRGKIGTAASKGLLPRAILVNKLDAIMHQTNRAVNAAEKALPHKQKLAAEAHDLMTQKGISPGADTADSRRLEEILGLLQDDLDQQDRLKQRSSADVIAEAKKNPAEAKKRIKELENELSQFDEKQKPKFDEVKKDVTAIMNETENNLKKGVYDDPVHAKKMAMDKVKNRISTFEYDAVQQKKFYGEQLTQTMNGLAAAEGAIDTRGRQKLDRLAGVGLKSAKLNKVANGIEKAGIKIATSKTGKLFVAGVGVMSLLPTVLEAAAAAGQEGAESEAAYKAAVTDCAEAGLGFIPVVGEVLDCKAAIMGTDLNGRTLSTNQRIVSGLMGGLGAASIGLGFFTGGLSIAGFRLLRGSVGAIRATKVLSKGAKAADAIDGSIDVVRAAQKQSDILKGMSNVSDAQKAMIKTKKYVDNSLKIAQIGTYAHLGWQLGQGIHWVATNTESAFNTVTNKAISGVDTVQSYIHEKTS